MPVTLRSGRPAQPYVMVVWMPATCSAEQRMMYAGAREVLRAEAGVGRVLEGEDEEVSFNFLFFCFLCNVFLF